MSSYRFAVFALILAFLVTGCAHKVPRATKSKPTIDSEISDTLGRSDVDLRPAGHYSANTVTGDFASYPALDAFLQR